MRSPPWLASAALRTAARSHSRLLKSGSAADACAWNKVLSAYSRAAGLADAHKLFDDIPLPDAVSWNALIAAHVSSGAHERAWSLLRAMMATGLYFDQYTLGSVLKSVASSARIDHGRQLHSLVVRSGLSHNVFAGSALVDMYAKCRWLGDALSVFELMPEKNVVSWNALIAGYCEVGMADAAFSLLDGMERENLMPDEATFASLLTLMEGTACSRLLCQLHAKILKYGRAMDSIVYNAAITAYSQCGSIVDSRKIFNCMDGIRELVTWNSMLAAYACHGLTNDALNLFVKMQEVGVDLDMYSFTSIISACFEIEHHDHRGRILHGLVLKKGFDGATPVTNALIGVYIRSSENGSMEDAVKCFQWMICRDSVSWNSILTGFSQSGLSEEALKFFGYMKSEQVTIDQYAFSAALRSCSDLAVLQLGRQIHGTALGAGFSINDFVASSLIFMYSKCGIVDDARRAFDEADKSSSVVWNSIIFGYAQHGQGRSALDIFTEMQRLEVRPDHITFVGLISACSHSGLVEEGYRFLNSMQSGYGIPLRMEHYACGVDLLGRAGRLEEAKELIESMPFEPDAMVWMTFLGACRIHGEMESASEVAEHLLEAEPREHATYVLLSSLYSGFGMWGDRATVQKAMRNRGLSKVPGWSWIEVKDKVHSFNAEDRSHPRSEEIYEMLRVFIEGIERMSSCESDELYDCQFG